MKKLGIRLLGIFLLCCILSGCKSSTFSNPNSVVGKWEFKETDVDVNTNSIVGGILSRALPLLSSLGKEMNMIKGNIQFTKKGDFIANGIQCNYVQEGDNVVLDQSILKASKLNTTFKAQRRGNELYLTYDAKEAATGLVKGLGNIDLSALEDGKMTFIFKKK